MWIELFAVMRKELSQAFRDRRMAALLFVAPILQLTVLGYAVDLDVDHIPTVLCDQDRTPGSRDVASHVFADGTYLKVGEELDPEAASKALEQGKAAVAVIIPAGFEKDLARQVPVSVQFLIDGTDPNRAQIASNSASQILALQSATQSQRRLEQVAVTQGRALSMPAVHLLPRVYYNPRLRSATYMVPGVAAMVVLVVTTIVTAMGIARERELGTLEQLLVTPLRPSVLLVGKCLPFAGVGLIDVMVTVAVGAYLFEVPIRGSLLVVAVSSLLYLMTTLGVGVFISTMSSSQQQAILSGFFFIMPAILLSGFMTPVENMPGWIRPISYLDPVRYFVEILRAVLLKGAGFGDLLYPMGMLAIFGVAILTISSLRFRKRLG